MRDGRPEIVSLCSGIGGLDMAVQYVYGATLRAYGEIAPGPVAVMQRHHPGMFNVRDITRVTWNANPGAVDIVTGGFPCQDISNAGQRTGLHGARSGIYIHVIRAVRELRPRLVVLENVAAILGRGGPTVVRALTETGYDTQWITIRASDAAGACHPRNRWFCVARARDAARVEFVRSWRPDIGTQSDASGNAGSATEDADRQSRLWPGSAAASGEAEAVRPRPETGRRSGISDTDWGPYGAAIKRWELIIGRPAPTPHRTGPRGGITVSPVFVEWMMGYPAGWVTGTPGLTCNAQMTALGNAVMPQHAASALTLIEGN